MTDTTTETFELSHPLVRISYQLKRIVDYIGGKASYFILPLIGFTMIDVFGRKLTNTPLDFQLFLVENVSPYFQSTMLQELEWHSHTVMFTLVLGYGYIWNTHVRVDLVRETLAFRKKAWLEFLGLTIFYIPFCCILAYFSFIYAYDAWRINEISASLVGLSHRWAIKSFLFMGVIVAIIAGLAVWLQVAMALFGNRNKRYPLMTIEWPEDTGSMVEGKERLDLEKAEDLIEVRARERDAQEKST